MKTIQFASLAATVFCCSLTASAQTWTQTGAPNKGWSSVASSADGTKLVACDPTSSVEHGYFTTNSGKAWVTNSVFIGFAASAADGSKWVGTGSDRGDFVSTNSCITWQPVAISDSGPLVGISADAGIIAESSFAYTSTNFGVNWQIKFGMPSGKPFFPANGSKWMTFNSKGLYISTDRGTTWITNSVPSTNILTVALSAKGNKIVAIEERYIQGLLAPSPVYTSTNSGISWLKTTAPSNAWADVASSADGNKLVAVAGPLQAPYSASKGGIYTSTNGGIDWVSNNIPVNNWSAVASSADGCKLVATIGGGGIYTSYSIPTPQLNLTTSPSNLTCCWTIPSTNFILQQSSDLVGWSDVTNVPTLNFTNLQNQVTLPASSSYLFFRLKTP